MRRIYLDTSAYVATLLDEEGADAVRSAADNARYASSVLLILEARRTLVRLSREGTLDIERYFECVGRVESDVQGFELRDVSLDLCDLGAMPSVGIPTSLDLVHLRTALWFHAQEPLADFVSLDLGQLRAAHLLGLPTSLRPKPS